MYNFFIEETQKNGDVIIISGADYNHIKNVLRMKVGDSFLVSHNKKSSLCAIKGFDDNTVTCTVVEENFQNAELPVKIHLYQGLPKSDKLELIIQKAVELGVSEITPVETARSIVKIDKKKEGSKTARWQAIAESAGKQSKRSIIPTVNPPKTFNEMLNGIDGDSLFIVPYENADGMAVAKEVLSSITLNSKICVLIGPEGGFDQKEIDRLTEKGCKIISLGKRILRTETAAITALSMLMLHIEMNL